MLLIVAVVLAGTALGIGARPAVSAAPVARITSVYLPIVAVQWGLLAYVTCVGRTKSALRSLLGEGGRRRGRLAADVALAVAAFVAIEALAFAWARASGTPRSSVVSNLVPRTSTEQVAWLKRRPLEGIGGS